LVFLSVLCKYYNSCTKQEMPVRQEFRLVQISGAEGGEDE
jgi:hypothetical protein